MTKRVAELLLLTVFLVLAVFLYNSTASYPQNVQGSTANYVRFLAISLGILCATEICLCLAKVGEGRQPLNIAKAPFRFWGLLISLIVYSVILEPLGFYIASALFLPITMVILGARKKLQISLTSLGVLVFVYLVFEKLLTVPLPERLLFS
ncbi:MAG: tripartite tricarboxylate transporter TctB family protein [Desulfotalea sp.]